MIKESILQEDTAILKVYVPSRVSKHSRQHRKEARGKNSITLENFNAPLSAVDRSSRQKITTGTADLSSTINQPHLLDIYRTLYLAAEHILLSSSRAHSPIEAAFQTQGLLHKFK